MPNLTARQFQDAFLEAYNRSRVQFSDEVWERVKTTTELWNRFMLWKALPPKPLKKSVVLQTAEALGLEYWDREPLKLDGAFCAPGFTPVGNLPFPITVAIEHENVGLIFNEEIVKLLSVRCPLKVGITYGERSLKETRASFLDTLKQSIFGYSIDISKIVGEDQATQYLFLVGIYDRKGTLDWHALNFSAGQILDGKGFEPCAST